MCRWTTRQTLMGICTDGPLGKHRWEVYRSGHQAKHLWHNVSIGSPGKTPMSKRGGGIVLFLCGYINNRCSHIVSDSQVLAICQGNLPIDVPRSTYPLLENADRYTCHRYTCVVNPKMGCAPPPLYNQPLDMLREISCGICIRWVLGCCLPMAICVGSQLYRGEF